MGWFAAVATVASGLVGAKASIDAGKAQNIAYKQQAQAERDAAQQREVERKRRLIGALGGQVVSAAAGNVDISSGSPRAVAKYDIQQAQRDYLHDTAVTGRRARSLIMAGQAAQQQGYYGAFTSLADSGARAYSLRPGG